MSRSKIFISQSLFPLYPPTEMFEKKNKKFNVGGFVCLLLFFVLFSIFFLSVIVKRRIFHLSEFVKITIFCLFCFWVHSNHRYLYRITTSIFSFILSLSFQFNFSSFMVLWALLVHFIPMKSFFYFSYLFLWYLVNVNALTKSSYDNR